MVSTRLAPLEAAASPLLTDGAISTRRQRRARAARAALAASLVAASLAIVPQPAFAAPGTDLGVLSVDCDGADDGYLDEQTVIYLNIGDTFVITNDEYQPCVIADPNSILTGEDADHSSLGAGVLDISSTTAPITIDAPGTFTIEDGAGRVKTFTVVAGISFRNLTDIGAGAAVGDSFLFPNVYYTGTEFVDATVTVVDLDGLAFEGTPGLMDYVDEAGDNWPLSPQIDVDDADSSGYATLRIAFHASGDPSTPFTLDEVLMTVKDIDSEQFIAAPGVSSFSLSSSPATALTATVEGDVLTVAEVNDVGSSAEDEDHWAVLRFGSVSSITLTVGANQTGSASFDVLFTEPAWTETPTTQEPADLAPAAPELAETGANAAVLVPGVALLGALLLAGAGAIAFSRRGRYSPGA